MPAHPQRLKYLNQNYQISSVANLSNSPLPNMPGLPSPHIATPVTEMIVQMHINSIASVNSLKIKSLLTSAYKLI